MPDVMFRLDNQQIGVTTSKGLTTTYKFSRYDLAYETVQGGTVAQGYQLGQEFSPRLTFVSAPNNSGAPILRYDYKNLYHTYGNSEGSVDYRLQKAGITMSAALGEVGSAPAATYDLNRPVYMDIENVGGPYNGINYVRVLGNINGAVGAIDYADTDDGRIYFEHTPRNFPTNFNKHSAPNESYGYDARGNLESIGYSGVPARSIIAEYPTDCDPTPRKICNQATRIRDANGNWTNYTYHAPSGQVASITLPANKNGVRPETRYTYQQKYATYYDASGVLTQGTSIWLKTSEEYCINSSAVDGNCSGGDEVVTAYEYEPKNLLLKSMTVTAPDGVRRTCYRYDIYGNQIGVTTPNANLGSCP
jgi:hypothetical protein